VSHLLFAREPHSGDCRSGGVTLTDLYIYSMLDAVPPIHAESSHVATDKDPSK